MARPKGENTIRKHFKLTEETVRILNERSKAVTELREKYDLHMKVERYMSDEVGVPVTDKAFIKE